MDAAPILFRTVGTVAKPGQMVDGGKGGGSFERLVNVWTSHNVELDMCGMCGMCGCNPDMRGFGRVGLGHLIG